jgi:hypothetical protein
MTMMNTTSVERHRDLPPRCDDRFLRDLVALDFGSHGGGSRLARRLGVADSTASILRRGYGDLTKVAAAYGYTPSPDEADLWLLQNKPLDPKKAGRLRWTPAVDERIRRALREKTGLRALALELGTTRARILDRIARKHLDQPDADDPATLLEASRQRMIARLEANDRRHAQEHAAQGRA